MNSMDLHALMEKAAQDQVAAGATEESLRARADEQERDGFSVSADYTRCLASYVRAAIAKATTGGAT